MREIKIRDDAAETLRNAKKNGETFSDVVERLAGGASDGDGSDLDDLPKSHRERAEQLAASALTGNDVREIELAGISRREHLVDEYDIDPADYDDENALLSDLRAKRQ